MEQDYQFEETTTGVGDGLEHAQSREVAAEKRDLVAEDMARKITWEGKWLAQENPLLALLTNQSFCSDLLALLNSLDRGQPRYDHIRDPVSGGINAQVTLDDGSIFHSPLPMPDQDAACELAAKLALESVRKEVERSNSSRGPKTGQGVHGGGKQADIRFRFSDSNIRFRTQGKWQQLALLLDQLSDKDDFKEQLQMILRVKDVSSFEDLFEKLESTTEKDIALALIFQATVVQP